MYYGGRYYDPVLARFVSADPFVPSPGNPQNFNRYSYVENNPVNFTDPTGFKKKGFFRKLFRSIRRWITRNETASVILGVALQLSPSPAGHLIGTAMLTQTETGRNTLTAEIIAGTAVATYYCGGCGVAVGALVGEAIGGYSAYQAGGDVLAGVVVGGAIGAATGYLAGGINTETGSIWAQAAKGFAAGAIKGGGAGAAAGYAGGEGDAETILRSAAIGAGIGGALGAARPLVFGANIASDPEVQKLLRLGGLGLRADFSGVTVREGGLLGNFLAINMYGGITLPGQTVVTAPGFGMHALTILEELAHIQQYQQMGTVLFLAQWGAWTATYTYWNNPLEWSAQAWAAYLSGGGALP
jgi:hypothetical protein